MPRKKKQAAPQKPTIEYLNDGAAICTPDGTAAFAHLVEPDTAFNKTKHRITVLFNPKAKEVKTFFALLKKLNKGWLVSQGQKVAGAGPIPDCIKKADEKFAETCGVEVGTPFIQFSSTPRENSDGEVIPVTVINAAGKKVAKTVFGTDLVCVETTVAGYKTTLGIGITCYLNAVQLLESRYKGNSGGSTFGVRDEFLSDDDEDDESPGTHDEDLDEEEYDEDGDDDFDDDDDPSGGMV